MFFKLCKLSRNHRVRERGSRGGPSSLIPKPVFLIIVRFTYHFSVLPASFWLSSCFSLEHICDYALDLCYDSHLLLMRRHNFCIFCCYCLIIVVWVFMHTDIPFSDTPVLILEVCTTLPGFCYMGLGFELKSLCLQDKILIIWFVSPFILQFFKESLVTSHIFLISYKSAHDFLQILIYTDLIFLFITQLIAYCFLVQWGPFLSWCSHDTKHIAFNITWHQ